MNKKVLLIISGILSLLIGIVSFPLLFVYSMTQSSELDFLYAVFFCLIALGINLLIMAAKRKKQ
ncbi:MAG: hypothetical protein Q8L81_05060 [Bacteroidota bacterium]|nr:hypothetical protein [Bacteroidota bacterium]